MRPLLIALLAAAGLAAGPLLRVVIVRLSVPSGEPWRRTCPGCGAPVGWPLGRAAVRPAAGPGVCRSRVGSQRVGWHGTNWRDIRRNGVRRNGAGRPDMGWPGLGRHGAGWLGLEWPGLGWHCAGCRARLGPAPWAVEVAAAVLLGLLAAAVHPGLVLAAMCLLAMCTIPLAFVDLATRRLPDLLTGPAYLLVALFLLLAAAGGGDWSRLGRALLGGVAFAGFCLVLFLISPGAIGPGDIKLAASLGTALAWFGWAAVFGGALAGFLLGAAYGVALLVTGHASRKSQIPFGPFMIAGAFLVILVTSL
jgi:leader peptidase (prepilin peptidase) / N-methyltransferase